MKKRIHYLQLIIGFMLGCIIALLVESHIQNHLNSTKEVEIFSNNKTSITPSFDEIAKQVATLEEDLDREYVRYEIFNLRHRKRVFWWSFISSILIFAIVLAIISFSLSLSYIQFSKTINPTSKAIKKGLEIKGIEKEEAISTVKLNTDGVEISSSVIGLVILVISVAFFYLYLVKVYPIKEVLTNPELGPTEGNVDDVRRLQ